MNIGKGREINGFKGSRYITALLKKKISNIMSQEMEVVSLNNDTLPEIESFFSL